MQFPERWQISIRRVVLAASLFLLACALLPTQQSSAAETHSGGVPGGPAYVRLPPISFTVIGPTDKIDKQVSMMIDLELEKGKSEQEFEPYRRPLMDAFLVALTGLYEDENPSGEVASDDLKERLLQSAGEITGPDFVHQILVISIGERRAR